jgi:hypothetical protein
MSGGNAEFGQVPKSQACTRQAHRDCAHLAGWGGGFNPRRMRLESGAGLCPCTCHSSCPVALSGKRLTVPPAAWRQSCTCPGAEQERRRLDEAAIEFPDFGKIREEARRRSRARTQAFAAARARAAGKSRPEIRDIYVAELDRRGQEPPREEVLNAVVDRILGDPIPAARLAVQGLAQMGKGLYGLARMFRPGS